VGVNQRLDGRVRRHRRIRQVVRGSAGRPRLVVSRSLKHIFAQVVDDDRGATLAAASSTGKEFRTQHGPGGNIAAARAVGEAIARKAQAAGVTTVVFDRGGYKYHGRVKALADAARAAGLAF
jgi:large subunit ribosomal protein L18